MILKASERSSAGKLGRHLLNTSDNDHVEVMETRGFMSDDMMGAMNEAEALAIGTRCKNHLFSVSLSPPANERVSVDAFEKAISQIEKKLGLEGHPRVSVLHEKEGRRHAHCVWSRIDAADMKAINLPHFKWKLRDLSRDLYLEHGWQMPRGLMNSKERDPSNFNLAEWQRGKRSADHPGEIKSTIQECWAVSDSKASFAHALESRGLYLAHGDKRDYVVVTFKGDVFALPRATGKKKAEVAQRLGEAETLPTVSATLSHIASIVAPKLKELMQEVDKRRDRAMKTLTEERADLKLRHAQERQRLDQGMEARRKSETRQRAERLRGGVAGLWDRVTGERSRVVKMNEVEALQSVRRDRSQREEIVTGQISERGDLQKRIKDVRLRHTKIVTGLHRDLSGQEARVGKQDGLSATFFKAAEGQQNSEKSKPSQTREKQGPSLEM